MSLVLRLVMSLVLGVVMSLVLGLVMSLALCCCTEQQQMNPCMTGGG